MPDLTLDDGRETYDAPQRPVPSHGHTKGRSPACSLRWRSSMSELASRFRQWSHWKGLGSWTRWWIWRLSGLPKAAPHPANSQTNWPRTGVTPRAAAPGVPALPTAAAGARAAAPPTPVLRAPGPDSGTQTGTCIWPTAVATTTVSRSHLRAAVLGVAGAGAATGGGAGDAATSGASALALGGRDGLAGELTRGASPLAGRALVWADALAGAALCVSRSGHVAGHRQAADNEPYLALPLAGLGLVATPCTVKVGAGAAAGACAGALMTVSAAGATGSLGALSLSFNVVPTDAAGESAGEAAPAAVDRSSALGRFDGWDGDDASAARLGAATLVLPAVSATAAASFGGAMTKESSGATRVSCRPVSAVTDSAPLAAAAAYMPLFACCAMLCSAPPALCLSFCLCPAMLLPAMLLPAPSLSACFVLFQVCRCSLPSMTSSQ